MYRTNKVIGIFKIPAQLVSSCAFGGENLDTLFVTTGRVLFDFNTQQIVNQTASPNEGLLYMVKDTCAKGCCGRRAYI